MTTTAQHPTIVLVPGHWLGAWAWDEVLPHLQEHGHRTVPVTLPGADPADEQRATRTPADQAAMLLETVEQAAAEDGPVVLAAHSGANVPASVVLDRRPDLIRRMVWVDSGPVADGAAFAADTPADLPELPLPPFEELGKQASLDGLDEAHLAAFRERAVPVPGAVLRDPVVLTDDRRRDVPATLICTSFSAEQVRQMASSGDPMMAETATLRDVDMVDLPTGHWPMWSRPQDLARAIADAAEKE